MNPNDLPPEPRSADPIDEIGADYLLVWANQIDARIQSTDANAGVWALHLHGKIYGVCQQIIADYYGSGGERGDVDPVTLGHIKREYHRRQAVHEAKQRAIDPPPRRSKKRAPRRFIEQMQAKGMLLDRDPNDYDPR